ncbi:MAG: hypothetical protein ACXU9U_00195 [Parachlamydiaceae bacterium]
MMNELIDRWGFILMISILIFSWILFWGYTSDPFFSFLAALLAASMMWLAYIVIRMILLAFWKK